MASPLTDLYETTHLTDPKWKGLDAIPDHKDGRPGWDTPESAAEPEDERGAAELAKPSPAPDLALFRQVLAVLPRARPPILPHRCGEAGGSVVWLVDGNEVKLRKRKGAKNAKGDPDFMEFVEGGNGAVDPELCGPKEVYIDALLDPVCWPFVGYHECRERPRVLAGEDYDSVHNEVNEEEKALRVRFPDPWAALGA